MIMRSNAKWADSGARNRGPDQMACWKNFDRDSVKRVSKGLAWWPAEKFFQVVVVVGDLSIMIKDVDHYIL